MTQDPFAALRPRLLGIAYGIVGELAEAEDVVQDAWLRWEGAEREAVRDATGFLVATTTRLAIDRLRSARARRERYVGVWLPDPLVADERGRPVGGGDRGGAAERRAAGGVGAAQPGRAGRARAA